MNPQPFEQYQLNCIEERPSGTALIFYLSNFNIAWIFITETNAEISNWYCWHGLVSETAFI